ARRLGTEHRHGARRARPARRRRARDARARGAVAGLDLRPRQRGRRGPGERRSPVGHGAVRHDGDPVRAAGLLARPRVDHRIHVLGARAPRVRRGRARRRRPGGVEPRRRPPAPPRAPARDPDADRHRRHRPLRARRDARCPEPAVRAGRARQGAVTVPGYTTTRCTKRPDSPVYAAGTFPSGFVLRHGVRGSGVRLARSGTPAGRGRAGARLSRGDGRDRGQRGARRRGEFPRRRRNGVDRSARPAGVEGRRAVRRLLRDRRAAFGVAVLAIVAGAGLAAPLVTRGRPTAQGDIVATRFLPPLAVIVLGLTGWMPVARLVQAEVRSLAARPFVEGAVALGLSRGRVLWRHILPNALTPVIVAAALGLGNAITLEAGLSFLGLGVQPPAPSWGNMITSGRDTLVNAPWVAAAPGMALVWVVVACTLLGDALHDRLDPERRY